jgi:hypothetical protein
VRLSWKSGSDLGGNSGWVRPLLGGVIIVEEAPAPRRIEEALIGKPGGPWTGTARRSFAVDRSAPAADCVLLEHDALIVADPRTGCDRRLDHAVPLAVGDPELPESAQRRRATREEANAGARARQRVPTRTAVAVRPALGGAQAHRPEDVPQSRRGAAGGPADGHRRPNASQQWLERHRHEERVPGLEHADVLQANPGKTTTVTELFFGAWVQGT